YVAAAKPNAAEVAQKIGDGLISTAPDKNVVEAFGNGKPRIGMMHCAYDKDAKRGLERATKLWPNLALEGPLGQDLATPSDFEEAAAMVDEEDVAETTRTGSPSSRGMSSCPSCARAGRFVMGRPRYAYGMRRLRTIRITPGTV